MKCKKSKKLISVMIDNELDDSRKQALMAHLEECKSCNEDYEYFSDLEKSFSKETIEVSSEFRVNLWKKIDEYEIKSQKAFKKWVLVPLYAAAVCLILIFGVSSKLVYAYKSNIKNSNTDKILIVNYIKNCIMKINFTPIACFEFMAENEACIHELCCENSECRYCEESE